MFKAFFKEGERFAMAVAHKIIRQAYGVLKSGIPYNEEIPMNGKILDKLTRNIASRRRGNFVFLLFTSYLLLFTNFQRLLRLLRRLAVTKNP
ncbi:hypothetical protein [Thermodesulfovibrio hydrogeniphilus]